MSRKQQKIEDNQRTFDFSWEERVERYVEAREALAESVSAPVQAQPLEDENEALITIAVAVKDAVREWGGSREELVHQINLYFGRTDEGAKADPPACRRPMSIHMLNNHLSKPTEYPLSAHLLFAIHHITGSLLPAERIVAAEGAKVATGEELRQMTLGKLEETMSQLQRLKRELKGRR